MTSAIHTEKLSKNFGRAAAVDGLNLEVPEGAMYALVGPNGSGKTTTIKLLMNILRPSAGNARVLGVESRNFGGKALERVGYVSENQEMPEWMTVAAFLEYCRGFYPQWDAQLATRLVRQFELPLDRKLKHLSRGMRMKAAFASSLAYRPSLIMLDEPFTGLDPLVRDELIEELLERATEATIFISSHDLAEIESFASHVGFLEQGRLLFSEEMASLNSRFREVTVTFGGPAALPANLPSSWLQAQAADSVVRFVHSGFKEDESRRQIAEVFPGARDISFDAMSLRSIFLAIAKSNRDHAPAEQGTSESGRSAA
jgi:ABC-2 type transport system ATP-binding protein